MSAISSIRPSLRMASATNQAARGFSSTAQRALARMTLTGRLAAEPELQATSSGQDIIKYAIGSSHGPKDNRQTSWFRIASFLPEGAQRDYLLSLPKGTYVYVEGDASMRTFEDAEGKKHTNLSILQRSIEVLRRPSTHTENNESTQQ